MAPESDRIIWWSIEPYVPMNFSRTGDAEETREFLLVFSQAGDAPAAVQQVRDTGLARCSCETRPTFAELVARRPTKWQPPTRPLPDPASFALEPAPDALRAALALHVCRQDTFLIIPGWRRGEVDIQTADDQHFLEPLDAAHPEISHRGHEMLK